MQIMSGRFTAGYQFGSPYAEDGYVDQGDDQKHPYLQTAGKLLGLEYQSDSVDDDLEDALHWIKGQPQDRGESAS